MLSHALSKIPISRLEIEFFRRKAVRFRSLGCCLFIMTTKSVKVNGELIGLGQVCFQMCSSIYAIVI